MTMFIAKIGINFTYDQYEKNGPWDLIKFFVFTQRDCAFLTMLPWGDLLNVGNIGNNCCPNYFW